MKFHIGFPIDGSKPETSRVVIVKMHKSKHHTIDDYDQPFYLAKESGADWLMKRLPVNAQRDYRFHFTMIPPYPEGRVLNQFPYLGFSDSAACTLAFALACRSQNYSNKMPLVLISCAFKPHPLHLGLENIELDKVTQDDLQEAQQSLYHKYSAAKNHEAIALVLLKSDAQLLAEKTNDRVVALTENTFVKLAKNSKPCQIVSCSSQQFLLLARALGIPDKHFVSKTKKRWISLAIGIGMILLLSWLWTQYFSQNTADTELNEQVVSVVSEMANFLQKQESPPWNVQVSSYESHQKIGGNFVAKLDKCLETVFRRNPNFRYLKQRSINVKGIYEVTVKYNTSTSGIDFVMLLNNKEIATYHRQMKEIQDAPANNLLQMQKSLQLLGENNQGDKFSLAMSTGRGQRNAVYYHGENIKLHIRASQDCHLRVYYQSSDNSLTQIFPNSFHPDDKIKGNTNYQLPGENDHYVLEVESHVRQVEIVKAIASLTPFPQGEYLTDKMQELSISSEKLMEKLRGKNSIIAEAICYIIEEVKNEE